MNSNSVANNDQSKNPTISRNPPAGYVQSIPQTLRVSNFVQQQSMENFNGHVDSNSIGGEYVIEETTYAEDISTNSRSQQPAAFRNRVTISFIHLLRFVLY
jgi:hypothetical protein